MANRTNHFDNLNELQNIQIHVSVLRRYGQSKNTNYAIILCNLPGHTDVNKARSKPDEECGIYVKEE